MYLYGMKDLRYSFSKLNQSFAVERGAQRFRELILYISKQCENDVHFGATKLNKILYYSDFIAFERFGSPLTGRVYFKLPQGPAPKPLLPVRKELEREGALRVEKREVAKGYVQERTIALREPVLSHFTPDEIALVDEVIKDLWSQTATEVSDASHDVRWRILNMRDSMPYELAYLDSSGVSEEDNRRTSELASQLGW